MHHRLPLSNQWPSTPACTLTCPIDVPSLPHHHPNTAQPPNTLSGIYSSTWRADQPMSSLHPSQRPPAICLCPKRAASRADAPPPPPSPNSRSLPLLTRAHAPSPPWTGHPWINGHGSYPVPSPCPFRSHTTSLPLHTRTRTISFSTGEEREVLRPKPASLRRRLPGTPSLFLYHSFTSEFLFFCSPLCTLSL